METTRPVATKRLVLPVLLAVALSASAPVFADMYRWTDRSGVVHYSSQAGDPSAELLKDEDLAPVTESGVPAPAAKGEKIPGAGTNTLSGRLLFDGKPFSLVSTAQAAISVYRYDIKQWYTPDYTCDPGTGTFQIRGLVEGTYQGQALVDADASNPEQYPGDYKGSFRFTVDKSAATTATADMERMIHLTGPADNGAALEAWGAAVCENKVEFETPVVVSWEPIAKDVSYRYVITRTVCKPFAFKERVAMDETKAARVALGLKPNEEGEIYTLTIEAWKDGRRVGSLMTHGKNGWGWDYRFRVLPKRGPTRVISPVRNNRPVKGTIE